MNKQEILMEFNKYYWDIWSNGSRTCAEMLSGINGFISNLIDAYEAEKKELVDSLDLGSKCFMYINTPNISSQWDIGWERGYNKAIDDLNYIKEKYLRNKECE